MSFEMSYEGKETDVRLPAIKVIGVGGAGGNAVNRMISEGIHGVTFIAANTDVQVLEGNKAEIKIQLGNHLTRGLGAGGNPEIGERAAEESIEEVRKVLEDTDLLFITAGMGGGTGTGAAPIVASVAKEMGILTVAVVTTPFFFEGNTRLRVASEGLRKLSKSVDTLIRISNNKLLQELPPDTSIVEAFAKADETLHHGIKGISELITKRGYINLDFADVESVLRDAGTAMLGIGIGRGEKRAEEAAKAALESRLLERPIDNAMGIILNVSAKNITLREMNIAAAIVRQNCSEDADVKLGLIVDQEMPDDELHVTLIAAGLEMEESELFGEASDIPAIYRFGLDTHEEEEGT
ncbi:MULTISPECIES: cell division protein FtsZ [Kosmotoga]|jgi:cell division protein FtsZ|uniref:Cell division protein FtsZ n=1 Tax=Kosmotoga olearia (strain ATCC BAA-1733 / DSM 21960 / TBF 19.5.1) TaxID=521045 RepID=C5CDJ5_KOSOT|nr:MULTISPECIES: cell division protein FtsZ [Kosmotoga]ACR79079.1 cell division protein FtsZ [Kosmotoga olearia TBF 19.5.1]MDI3524426.1 cell division protein FtsZ [Kosmotoga sp.]MDK2953191.1 cell division protein FtsZ [Kosmotoga sp.]OAA23782.1 cell division protein FtsZ [Kosmotoga sp. DU53]